MTVHVLGGGTFSHVRSHLAIAAPAFGGTARAIHSAYMAKGVDAKLHLTKMADSTSDLVTNDDVAALIDQLVADPTTRVIYLNVALVDFDGEIIEPGEAAATKRSSKKSGKYADRLKTNEYTRFPARMALYPAEKIISRIRQTRKDILLVAFKTTSGATPDEQYLAGLNLLKANSANLVVANDVVTRNNMIIAPEETRYCETTDRTEMLRFLIDMVDSRATNTFTRSTVLEGDLVDFQSDDRVPDNLRTVVNHLVKRGAYKAFRNSTAGHFAVRVGDGSCLTSRRKTNYNVPGGLDLVEVEYDGLDKVIAYGAKPSVGGQSQRIVFAEHEGLDCIVHFHSPMRDDARDAAQIGHGSQVGVECGSHACGANTSRNLQRIGDGIYAVMLDLHGPNIVFSRDANPAVVIDFIEANFDVMEKTGGLVAA